MIINGSLIGDIARVERYGVLLHAEGGGDVLVAMSAVIKTRRNPSTLKDKNLPCSSSAL